MVGWFKRFRVRLHKSSTWEVMMNQVPDFWWKSALGFSFSKKIIQLISIFFPASPKFCSFLWGKCTTRGLKSSIFGIQCDIFNQPIWTLNTGWPLVGWPLVGWALRWRGAGRAPLTRHSEGEDGHQYTLFLHKAHPIQNAHDHASGLPLFQWWPGPRSPWGVEKRKKVPKRTANVPKLKQTALQAGVY